MRERPMCRHCGVRVASKPRLLCWPCYYAPGVRDLYPVLPCRGNKRGVGNNAACARLPRRATVALPGTRAKVAALIRRAKRGESLHHVGDARRVLT